MSEAPQGNRRKSFRLKEYDYSMPGAYFVTAVVRRLGCPLSEIVNAECRLTSFGKIVARAWLDLPRHYPTVELDEYIVMPDHFHGILWLADRQSDQSKQRAPLSEIMRAFKSFSARRIDLVRNTKRVAFWQARYYEHIVRDDADLGRIREYISNNPANWERDHANEVSP